MKDKILYPPLKSLHPLRCSILFIIMLLIIANPMIIIVTHLAEEKYELCENNTVEDKRVVDDSEDENQAFYSTHLHDLQSHQKTLVGDYYTQKLFADFNPSILVPPPKLRRLVTSSYRLMPILFI